MLERLWWPMEGRGRNLAFGFPGYDGCFPKATRSSRGRGDHTMRKTIDSNDLPKDMCVFELLATVAGQLLQEQNEEGLTATSPTDLEAPKVNVEAGLIERSASYDMALCSLVKTKGSKTTCSTMNDRIANEDSDKYHKHVMPMMEIHDTSAISCVENLNACMQQEHNSVPQAQDDKPCIKPVKAYSSRKKKNMGTFSSQGTAVGMLIKSELGEKIMSKSNQYATKVKTEKASDLLMCGALDARENNIGEKEDGFVEQKHVAGVPRKCQDMSLRIDTPFQVDAESPPLVSSGSSEETFFWKARDDDGNSSESTIPQNLLIKSSSMSYMNVVKVRRGANGTAKKKSPGIGSKRKRNDVEDIDQNAKRDAKHIGGKARAVRKGVRKMPLLKDEVDPIYMFVDSGLEDKIHATKVDIDEISKLTSSSSPSTTSSPSEFRDSNVKLSIKSFMVPELLVDMPESATVANLKKAVMEAAMNLLGGGLCVRVLLQGKKVIDETESLLQAGISNGGKLDSLGFMLEPNLVPASPGVEDAFLVLSQGSNPTSSRYPTLSKSSEINMGSFHAGPSEGLIEIDANSSGTEMQSTTVSPSKEDTLAHDSDGMVIPGPRALILHSSPTTNGSNGLAVVPFGQSPGSMCLNKRRIRRPFSVGEVELLVQAVEKLGTGRWRDVKLHAFPQAKHRTYVDLKDKWKTLVHTASIAPHQRRGEPVPQGLLDRVIQAHSYWTTQQAKQQSLETKVL